MTTLVLPTHLKDKSTRYIEQVLQVTVHYRDGKLIYVI